MRTSLSSALAVACLLVASPAFAQQPGASFDNPPTFLSNTALLTVVTERQDRTKTPGYSEWNERLQAARAKRGKGLRWSLVGLGVSVSSGFFAGNPDTAKVGLLVALAGTGMIGYGGYMWYTAKEDIQDLDMEGRTKGFLTVRPVPGGAAGEVTVTF